jgi:hypothetical protein
MVIQGGSVQEVMRQYSYSIQEGRGLCESKSSQKVTKVIKNGYCLSWLTNSALLYEPKCSRRVAGSQSMSTAVYMEPK